jgi:hypothetical protein
MTVESEVSTTIYNSEGWQYQVCQNDDDGRYTDIRLFADGSSSCKMLMTFSQDEAEQVVIALLRLVKPG